MRKRTLNARRHARERGGSLLEFVLCFAFFWCPFFFGMWNVGMILTRDIQVTEVCRDAAHMLAFGIDFSQTANQTMLQFLAQGLNLTSSGSSVVILSVVTYLDSSCNCANQNQYVLTRRIIIGNPAVISSTPSAFGNPPASLMDGSGNISQATYQSDSRCIATAFANYMPVTGGVPALGVGPLAFVGEMTLMSTDLGGKTSSALSIF